MLDEELIARDAAETCRRMRARRARHFVIYP
jgi:hypothetical protein